MSIPRRQLTLFDSTCLIVGIILGAGLYQMAPTIARGVGSAWGVPAIWIVGGLLSLCGALGYAELGAAWPRAGGDYVYLSRAYGPWAGFLFGWIQLVVVRPGDIAVMAFAAATFGGAAGLSLPQLGFLSGAQAAAVVVVLVLTGINLLGVREGKWTQNLLTVVKVSGLVAVTVVALFATREPTTTAAILPDPIPLSVALILVLFTYGGWNEMAYVAAEVRDPGRNIVRALVLGTVAITGIYLAANLGFLHALGYAGLAASESVAADAVTSVLPEAGGRIISALVCVSALGAVNGLVFTGARISYAVGADHRAFRLLGRWDGRRGQPLRALLVQALVAIVLIVALGSFLNTILYTAAAVYTFYLGTSLAVIVLRRKEPDTPRPYRVTGYPVTTVIFCAVCGFLIHGAVTYAPTIAAASAGLILLGVPVYLLSSRADSRKKD